MFITYRSKPKYRSIRVCSVPKIDLIKNFDLKKKNLSHTIIECMTIGFIGEKNGLKYNLSKNCEKTNQTDNKNK